MLSSIPCGAFPHRTPHRTLVAFDTSDNLEKQLLAPNEIIITAETEADEVEAILSELDHITEIGVEEKEPGFTVAHIKTNHDNIYDVSRAIFLVFAGREKVMLEMTLKRGNLEDVFIELSEGRTDTSDVTKDTIDMTENIAVKEITESEVDDQ